MTATVRVRGDLLALDPDTLAAMSNRGLVKRATRELDAGSGPELACDEDGTVRGTFADGARTVLPPGAGLTSADCDCGAAGVCRHRIGLVLAYQRAGAAGAPAEPFTDWSPGSIDDEALTVAVGARAMADARRSLARGYSARLHRPTPEQPAAWAELPTCTVRFPVAGELGHVITDAATALRGEVTALAVWAFRAADAAGRAGVVQVDVGGRGATGSGLDVLAAAAALADSLLLEGAAQAGPVLTGSLRRMREELTAASLHWPAGALADAADQVEAYAARSTRYRATALAAALGELRARHRTASAPHPAGTAMSQVLGSRESGTTALRRVAMTALGCRVGGTAQEPVAEVYFAHAGTVLVLRRRWSTDEPLTGAELGSRRVLGSPLAVLATSNVVSESVSRSASRVIEIGRSRVATTSVTALGGSWSELPAALLVQDLARYAGGLAGLPPGLLRPRVEAENVRVVRLSDVGPVGYDPAQQRLEAEVTDASGHSATVAATYNPLCPGALDVLAEVLGSGEVRYLSGSLTRTGRGIVIDPLGLMTADHRTVVPDLADHPGGTELPHGAVPGSGDPVTEALDTGLAALADAAHLGLRRLRPSTLAQLHDAATGLARIGLGDCAALLRVLLTDGRAESEMVTAWTDAQIRLTVAAELHREGGAGADGWSSQVGT